MSMILPSEEDDIAPQKHLMEGIGRNTRLASQALQSMDPEKIDHVLDTLAKLIIEKKETLILANQKDVDSSKNKRLSGAMIDRLTLNSERIESMANGVKEIAQLPCPVGKILWETKRPNGLNIQRISVPLGVLGMIYESRPNVTIDAAALCLKSKNAVILRGGSESFHSNMALHAIIRHALIEHGLPAECVSIIPQTDRSFVLEMLHDSAHIDVIIPRGGKGLVELIQNEAKMPVFSHLDGVCHTYVHQSATPKVATDVTLNAKMRRTGICGAMETLLLDKNLSKNLAKDIIDNLIAAGCKVVGDEDVQALNSAIEPATDEDWEAEYLDKKLSCRYVDDVQEAVKHINTYGSHHTESILSEDQKSIEYFNNNVNSAIVMHNTSTQFADGGEFGLGAEIGIATGKFHARGPVGLEQLCTYKYIVSGNGQVRP